MTRQKKTVLLPQLCEAMPFKMIYIKKMDFRALFEVPLDLLLES